MAHFRISDIAGHFAGGRGRLAVISMLVLGLAGCEGLNYKPPASRSIDQINLGTQSVSAGVDMVASKLRAAGMDIISKSRATGKVLAYSEDPSLVDCGVFKQTIDGNRGEFAGNAPRAVIFNFDAPGDLVVRETRTESHVAVVVKGASALVGERHKVTLSHLTVDRSRAILRERKSFENSGEAVFEDGTICKSARSIYDIL